MKRNSALTLGVVGVAAALVLTGCSSSSGSTGSSGNVTQAQITKAMSTPTTVTFWTWVPGIAPEVAKFEKKYPKIKVDVVNAGQGNAEYTKLQSAVEAGKGAPDVAQLEYSEVPSFVVSNSLSDLTADGAASLKSDFAPGAWSSVIGNGKIYGLPQDAGPMVFMYRADLLKEAGVSVPKTWADFATAAAAVKAKTGAAMVNLGPTDSSEILGMLQQAGANPFSYDGKKTIKIDLTSSKVKTVADYLTKLIQSGNVAVDPAWTNDWYQGFASSKYAGWLVGAWGPDDLTATAGTTAGKWRAAPMPQWTSSSNSGGNWGGSADVVMKSSKNQIASYEFIKFLNSDPASAAELNSNPKSALFPTLNSVLKSSSFSDQTSAFFGGQQANKVYAKVSATVAPFDFLPYMDYASSSYNDTVGDAISKKTDIYTAFQAWEKLLVDYGKKQGFTVN